MLVVKLLGGICVEGARTGLTGRAAQRRRLALLTVLSANSGRGVSRDKLMALLWPESDSERARHQVASCVYDLRQAMGETAIQAAGDELRLNPEQVRTDIKDFEDALAVGDWEQAVALYRGPFLDGFFLVDAAEFEHWVEAERRRLAHGYERALSELAEHRDCSGDPVGAVEWWRLLAAHEPFSSRIALRLMQSLAKAGDPAGALQYCRIHEALLRDEVGAEPPPELAALAKRIQSGHEGVSFQADTEPTGFRAAAPVPLPPASVTAVVVDSHSPLGAPAAAGSGVPPVRRRRRLLYRWMPIPAAVALLGLLGVRVIDRLPATDIAQYASPLAGDRLAVFPFEVRGSKELEYLGGGMVSLLGAALDGVGRWHSLDARTVDGVVRRADVVVPLDGPAAHRLAELLGSAVYVVGDVVEASGRVRIHAALYEVGEPRTPRAQASVEGDAAQVFILVDRLAAQLLASSDRSPGQRTVRSAVRTTNSIPAFKAYLEGEHEMWQGRWDRAMLAFQRATAEDSTFALAWYRLSLAAEWFSRGDVQREAAERAVRHMDRLSDRDRSLLQALVAWRRGAARESEQHYQAIVGAYPDDVDAWLQLGEVGFHYGALLGRPTANSRAAWERVLDIEANHAPALFHLARIAALEERDEELDSLTRRIALLQPDSERALEMQAFRALRLGGPAERRRLIADLDHASDNTLILTVRSVVTYLGAAPEADALVELLTRKRRSLEVQALGHLLLAHTAAARGRWHDAESQLRRVDELRPSWGLENRAALALAQNRATPSRELARLRTTLLRWDAAAVKPSSTRGLYVSAHDGIHPHLRLYLLGMVNARLGDHTAADQYAVTLGAFADNAELAHSLAHRVRAESFARRGMTEQALAELDSAQYSHLYDYSNNSPFFSQASERLLRADLLRQLGRPHEALRWYSTLREVSPYEFVHLGPALLAQAEIHEELDQPHQAAALYLRLAELWQDSDESLRPYVELAKGRVQRLRGVHGR